MKTTENINNSYILYSKKILIGMKINQITFDLKSLVKTLICTFSQYSGRKYQLNRLLIFIK